MKAEEFISCFEGVRQTGPGRWIARCPAHTDHHPSLSIRELEDGRILLHDFGGCDTQSVVAAIGLGMGDLFPEQAVNRANREYRPFPVIDILRCVAFEALVVAAAASAVSAGESLSIVDRERLTVAISRLRAAVDVANG